MLAGMFTGDFLNYCLVKLWFTLWDSVGRQKIGMIGTWAVGYIRYTQVNLANVKNERRKMKAYKLTEQDNTTYYHSMTWKEGITHEVKKKGRRLCSDQVIHAYRSPELAILMNPAHANINNPKLWACEVSDPVADDGIKIGVKRCTTIREIEIPIITTVNKMVFAILCAKEVYKEKSWSDWADRWLRGVDRTSAAAHAACAAAHAAHAADNAADNAADYAAAHAACAADYAAYAAAHAAHAADYAAYAADYAAYAAAHAACAAAYAAYAACAAHTKRESINFNKIIKEALS